MSTTIYETALAASAAGLNVLPPREDGSKAPDATSWTTYQERRSTEDELEGWYARECRRSGLGAVTGRISGNLELFEFDGGAEVYEQFRHIAQESGLGDLVERIEAGYLESSPNGIHWLYRSSEIGPSTALARRPVGKKGVETLIETRGEGGYAILAPSCGAVHPSGKPYVLRRGSFDTIATISADERRALFELARTFDQVPLRRAGERHLPRQVDGERPGDDYIARTAWEQVLEPHGWTVVYSHGGITYWRRPDKRYGVSATTGVHGTDYLYVFTTSTIFEAGRGYNKFSAYALLNHAGDFKAAAGALAAEGHGSNGAGAPRGKSGADKAPDRRNEHLTDWGNAQRLVRLHGGDLRYCHTWGKWLIWDKRRWRTDDTGRVYRLAKSAVRTILAEAKAAMDSDVRMAIVSWAMKSESQARLEAMIASAQSEPRIPVRVDDLDANAWLFNCSNGTINLRTGELRPHNPDELITKVGGVKYDSDAKCPVFDAFLDKIMAGDEELIEYLQRTLGRALTGDVSEHRLEMWYGVGSNGKSTLITAMLGVMGDYGLMAAPGLLLRRRQEAHPTEVADLKGARFVSSVEIGESRKLNEEQVKQLSGGDRLKARYMRQDYWEFDPSHKLFVACNHRPTIVGSDHAIWRRMKLVPFSVVIPDKKQDKALGEKLRCERSGILNWLIKGCLDWQRHGLTDPEAVRAATADYRAEQDLVGAFVAECCTIGPNAKALTANLYDAYVSWCQDSHEEPLAKRAFGLRLGDQGFTRGKGSGGKRWWFGIGLKAQQTMDTDTK